MIDQPRLADSSLTDERVMKQWCDDLQTMFDNLFKAGQRHFAVSVHHDKERSLFLPKVVMTSHGINKETVFGHEFFQSGEYQAIAGLGEKVSGLIEESGYVRRGEKQEQVDSFAEALDWLMQEAKRGYMIQRYKGLGEMNPDQLWETTMDPEVRRMLQVSIEDAIAADQMFTTLMGDQVEPRREFIEENALSVANLDI